MPKQKKKIIVILGQTAVGKSALAVKLAKRFGGEIISADSRQVYTGLNIGTGKITKKEMQGVKHYLLDAVNLKQQFTVAEYLRLARKAVDNICMRGKVPIVCGGTGFYIDALLGEISFSEVPPNHPLRRKLGKKPAPALYLILKKLDPKQAKTIDRHNPRRLIRAIEIARSGQNKTLAEKRFGFGETFNVLKIGLTLPDEELKGKITIRLFARIRDGMIGEAERLHKRGLSWKRMRELGLEYKYLARYLRGEISKKEMTQQLEKATWHYSKRQKTWFKRDKKIKWFTPKSYKQVEKVVRNFLAS